MPTLVSPPALPQPAGDLDRWAPSLHASLMNTLTSFARAINTNSVARGVAPGSLIPGTQGEIVFISTTLKPAYFDGTDWRYFDTNAVV